MKLSPKQVERTLDQFTSQVIPDDHPAVVQLSGMFGEHTFFVDGSGLNIVEPVEPAEDGREAGQVVRLASWSDSGRTSLAPHEPEATDVVVVLAAAA